MNIKLKKRIETGRIIKIQGGGEIKEILMSSDIMNPEKEKISICFLGKNNSGIVELSLDEINNIYKTVNSKFNPVKNIKIIKERK